MTMPTGASVTEVPCTCGYLERKSLDPDTPVDFDPVTNEFSFTYPWKGAMGLPAV